jgi:hypothetical protein
VSRDEDLPPLDLERSYGIGPLVAADTRISQAEYAAWLEAALWRPSRVPGLEVANDLSAAGWIAEHLHPGTLEVRMTVPDCFEAYARIFFAYSDGETTLTWTELARRNGRVAHALMEQETVTMGHDRVPERWFPDNLIIVEQYEALIPILARHTDCDRGWFLLWDGYGGIDPRPFQRQPLVEHQFRSYHLLCGPLDAFADLPQAPSYFWPDDRAWCLCMDLDMAWAYLAGTATCRDEVIATPILDAYRTEPTNPARSGMDTINDPTGVIPRMF